jgi:integrase
MSESRAHQVALSNLTTYKDHPGKANPGLGLESFRILERDRPKVDPFTIQEAEQLIEGIHRDWGEAIGNFDEFRFFTGLRQSEQISLRLSDCDLMKGTIHIHQVVVLGRHKDRPKNNEERTVELCPRALSVLRRQCVLRERLMSEHGASHDYVFLKDDGEPIESLQYVYGRRCSTIDRSAIRYRAPYNARHSCVSWGVGRWIAPPASRRTEREALTSLSSRQINEPIIPAFQ